MWFYDISKHSIRDEMRPTRIDGRLLFHDFFHVPTNAHILLAATGKAACHEELCMTRRQIRIPNDDSFFFSHKRCRSVTGTEVTLTNELASGIHRHMQMRSRLHRANHNSYTIVYGW